MSEQALENLAELETEVSAEELVIVEELRADEQKKAEDTVEDIAARNGAIMAVGFVETILRMRFPYVQITPESKEPIIEKSAAVARKYGSTFPAWLEPYREEIELGMVVAATGFSVYMQIQAFEKAEELKDKKNREAADGNETHSTES